MLIVLPPGSGKSYYHALNRGVDTETLAMTVLGPAVVLHTVYVSIAAGADDEWEPYHTLIRAVVRAVISRWPASALPVPPHDVDRVDLLSNSWHLPAEHPSSQRHLRAVVEGVVAPSLRASGRSHGVVSAGKFVDMARVVTADEEVKRYFSARVGLGRGELEVESRGWTAGGLSMLEEEEEEEEDGVLEGVNGKGNGKRGRRPVMKREDVVWLREFAYADEDVVKAWGRDKVDEMRRVSGLRDLHLHLMDHVVD